MQRQIHQIRQEFETELFQRVLPFWQNNSLDQEHGGYFTCLDAKGNVFDTTKYMWLNGRQIWMFSKLYNAVDKKQAWLEVAANGMDFMRRHAVKPDGRVYFSLNAAGQPVYLQRKIFSECFYAMALAEYGRASEKDAYLEEARAMIDRLWEFAADSRLVGRPRFEGESPLQSLAVPMILLNVIEEVYGADFAEVKDKVDDCIQRIRRHFVDGVMYEHVLSNGDLHDSAQGRLLNPGHAIEAGWFLMHWAITLGDQALEQLATDIIRKSFDQGWDREYGGLFYFLDAEGRPPLPLEWNMKLWWPHSEALYAFLLLYQRTGEESDWEIFLQVKDYAFTHFSDPTHGEWFGYLNRDGKISSPMKGGPYKGCFHVPRALWLCWGVLGELGG